MIPNQSRLCLIVLIAMLFAARSASAWNTEAHEAISAIAWDQLSDTAKQTYTKILKQHPRLDKDLLRSRPDASDVDRTAFIVAAAWPDIIRIASNPYARSEGHQDWHYVDFPFVIAPATTQSTKVNETPTTQPTNLLQAYALSCKQLTDPTSTPDRRAIALCWILHLEGDVHQPLHTANLFSNTYPDGDRGGNSEAVRKSTGKFTNLHSFWDQLEGTANNPKAAVDVARRLEKDHPPSEFTEQLKKTHVHDWAAESFEIAKSKAYLNGELKTAQQRGRDRPTTAPSLPADYEAEAVKIADKQIALAGYRLAAALEAMTNKIPK